MPLAARHRIALAALLVAALVLAGCSRIVGPRQWTATAQLAGGGTQTIDVRDTSGRIDEVEIDPAGVVAAAGVSNPPGQPNVAIVSWTGGACDARTDIAIATKDSGIGITVATTVRPGDCDAIGVGHVLRITSGEPLPAGAISVKSEPPKTG